MPTHFHTKDLRHGRFSQAGQIYLMTAVTLNRQPVFASFDAARTLMGALRAAQDCGYAQTLAFVGDAGSFALAVAFGFSCRLDGGGAVGQIGHGASFGRQGGSAVFMIGLYAAKRICLRLAR